MNCFVPEAALGVRPLTLTNWEEGGLGMRARGFSIGDSLRIELSKLMLFFLIPARDIP